MKTQLPESLNPGDTLNVQLSPFGTFTGSAGGRQVAQLCDEAAFGAIVKNFSGEVLVDFEHDAETGGPTTAAAWVQGVSIDPEKGLMATFKFTDVGADAVSNRRLRYLSPVWTLGADGRPQKLISVGLTNKPNLPVNPVLNREQQRQQKENAMQKFAQALGLPPETPEADILAALAAMKQQNDALTAAANEAEAEKVAEENKDKIANREAFKSLFKKDRTTAMAVLNCVKAPDFQKVCNKRDARPPAGGSQAEDAQTVRNRYDAMKPGADKEAFAIANKAALLATFNPEGN